MRAKWLKMVLPLAVVAGLTPAAVSAVDDVVCPDMAPPPLEFGTPRFIDKTRAGGEPVSVVAADGSISVSAHAGTTHAYKSADVAGGAGDFAVGYTNQTLNWRSTDGGDTWQYVGLPVLNYGPHSLTSTGFSDPDFSIDAGGRIYNVEIDLANVSVFSSVDDGQSYTFANPESGSGDRPWVTGGDKDEAFLYINLPQQLLRSTDGGLTWLPANPTKLAPPVTAKLWVDPLKPGKLTPGDTGLIGPVGGSGVAFSPDDGKTWTTYNGAGLGKNNDKFGAVAVDSKGTVYRAAAGGYTSASDKTPDGQVTFNWFDRTAKKWGTPVELDIPEGDAFWPWIVAGDDGRVAIGWYQNHAGKPNEFYTYVAYTLNGHGSTVTCSDGSTQTVPPQFSVANASGRPVHVGQVCQGGTGCNTSLGDPGDRRLGDFFTINFDLDGTLFVATADTTLPSPTGGPKVVGNPLFIKQTGGAKMLENPVKPRASRCLYPLPTC